MREFSRFVAIIFCLILCFFPAGCGQTTKAPQAVNGVLDLTSWDFENDGIVQLNGEWELYWRQLLSPEDFLQENMVKKTGVFTIPGRWDGREIEGVRQCGDGYATFRITVHIRPDDKLKAIRIRDASSAYRLWIDGKEIARNGVVGTSRKAMTPQYLVQVKPLRCERATLELILQVSNFNHRKGGVWEPIFFGNEDPVHKRQHLHWAFDMFLFGGLLIMSLYHAGLYLLRRKDPSAVFFAAFCLTVGIRIIVTGDRFLTYLFPGLSWEFVYTTELLTVTLSIPLMLTFVFSLYGEKGSKVVLRLVQGIGLLWSLIAIVTTARTSSHLVIPFQFVTLFAYFYITFILVNATVKKREGAAIMLAGFLVLFVTVINDILNTNDALYTLLIAPAGLLALVFSQSFVLSLRYSRAFSAVEQLSGELEQKNIALAKLDRLKNEFLANTSHELRTPLNGIIGLAESLLAGVAGKPNTQVAENLAMIVSSGKRLASLINDLLDFSRLRHKDIRLRKKNISLRTITELVITVSKELVQDKPVRLSNDIPENIPYVVGDEDRIQQILYNLIGNAIKFTERGAVTVSAKVRDGMVEVMVSDTGIGIPRDKAETIFQSFEQVDSGASRKFGGTGLGLPISRHLVELHGGLLAVESDVGRGSTFRFTIPISLEKPQEEIKTADETLAETIEAGSDEWTGHLIDPPPPDTRCELKPTDEINAEKPAGTNSGDWVMIVDDDSVNRQVIANQLSVHGIAYKTAAGGQDVLERIESSDVPALILLDIMMPGMTGYAVCRRLRETCSSASLPIILLTARNRVADLVKGFEVGANDYLTKPFSTDELMARVTCHLQIRKAHDTLMENLTLKQEVRLKRMQEEKAQLEKLRYQLNPHFLFNALSSIRGAILSNPQSAREMISFLAGFCRLTLSRGAYDQLTVNEELEIVSQFLNLEQRRLGDYLDVTIDIDPGTKTISIPAHLLQPLVENALKYGARTCPDSLSIRIHAGIKKQGYLSLGVSNTGRWLESDEKSPWTSTGIGIKNLLQRLERLYPGDYRFDQRVEEGWVHVDIVLPVRGVKNDGVRVA